MALVPFWVKRLVPFLAGLVRDRVKIEAVNDLINDLKQGLDKI
jgi:cystathionine beta-lyase/cystathionine gamma-synthase